MARDSSFLQYMRAHGNTPGPTQRPLVTGAITGLIASVPYEFIMQLSGASSAISSGFGVSTWLYLGITSTEMVLAGVLYAAVFKRAANDFHGGWLFGASYGFLLWMITPITLWHLFTARPVVVGRAAMGLFGAHLLYGIALGLAFPWLHGLVQTKLNDAANDRVPREHVSAVTANEEIKEG